MAFALMSRAYPLDNAHAKQFKRLCRALIVTYPFLLQQPTQSEMMIHVAHDREHETEWQIDCREAGLQILPNGNELRRSRVCTTMAGCDAVARKELKNPRFQFYAHSGFSRLVCIWGGAKRWTPSRSRVARVVSAARAEAGKEEAERRETKQEEENGGKAVGLAQLS